MAKLDFDRFRGNMNLLNHKPRVFSYPILGTILFGILLFIFYKFNQYISPWNSWEQATGNATHFCELNRFGQLIVQPTNTWSNLGFIIVGFIFLGIAKNDHLYNERTNIPNMLARFPGFTFLMALNTLFMGFGSFFYHATLTLPFQKMDQTGMYFLLFSFISYNLFKIFPIIKFRGKEYISNKFFIITSFLAQVFFFIFLWKLPVNYVFPTLVILFFFTNSLLIKRNKDSYSIKGYVRAGGVTFFLAGCIWILDITNKLCSPTSVFQGHAVWHILDAIAIFLVYLFFRSEQFIPKELENK